MNRRLGFAAFVLAVACVSAASCASTGSDGGASTAGSSVSVDRQAGVFYEDIRVCFTRAATTPETSIRWGEEVKNNNNNDISRRSVNLYTDASPECGFKDAEMGIPTLPVTVSVDGVNQDYQFKSVSSCFAYRLGQEDTYYCLPLNGTTVIPVASNNKIGITVTTSGAKEDSGIWKVYTFMVQVDGTGK